MARRQTSSGAGMPDIELRQHLRRAVRKVASQTRALHPWDAGFDHSARPCPPGLVAGAPDFVGIGVQKAGTSWWFDQVTSHPQIYHHPGYDKERHFLAKRGTSGAPYPSTLAMEYASWFPRPPGTLSGEWTPAYVFYYWVAELLRQVAPEAKILVLVRDPIDRYSSGLVHASRGGPPGNASESQRAFNRGFYAAQLSQWERLFGPAQMLVLQYERCVRDPRVELARTFRFLGVDDSHVPEGLHRAYAASPKPTLGDERISLLQRLYEQDVRMLVQRHPQLDLELWPNFRYLVAR